MENGKQVAYPIVGMAFDENTKGVTKREYFAVIALQGMLSNSSLVMAIRTYEEIKTLCEASVTLSDELLKQLEK